jgi:predicted nucleic acid-binding Zn ribbon protein
MDTMDNLTMDVLAAARAGMSYGQWKAKHPKTKQEPKKKKPVEVEVNTYAICPVCNKPFRPTGRQRVMCSTECRVQRDRDHKQAYAERMRAEKELRKSKPAAQEG